MHLTIVSKGVDGPKAVRLLDVDALIISKTEPVPAVAQNPVPPVGHVVVVLD